MKYSIIIILISLFFLEGCTVKYSFTGASIPPDAKTVSIAEFPNMAPLVNPLLSQQLTEALKDRFVAETNLQIMPLGADLQFEGTITGYNIKPVSIEANSDLAAQNRLTITIKVKYVNMMEPKANYETSFSRFRNYDSEANFETEQDRLVIEIIDELVDDMYNKAVVNW